jgi:hypothetical protein
MAMRSAMVKAESISWVTTTLVTPSCLERATMSWSICGAGDGVEARAGLVVEEDLGIEGEGAGEAGPFLHAAGDLGGVLVGVLAQADEFEFDLDLDIDDVLVEIGVLAERERDVLGEGHGVEERAGLEEECRSACGRCSRPLARPQMFLPRMVMVPSSG